MADIGIKEFKSPAAVLLPVEETEDFVLANADGTFRVRQEARAAYSKGRSVRLEDLG